MPGRIHLRLDRSGTSARSVDDASVSVEVGLPPRALASLRDAVLGEGASVPASLGIVEVGEAGGGVRWVQGTFVAAGAGDGPSGDDTPVGNDGRSAEDGPWEEDAPSGKSGPSAEDGPPLEDGPSEQEAPSGELDFVGTDVTWVRTALLAVRRATAEGRVEPAALCDGGAADAGEPEAGGEAPLDLEARPDPETRADLVSVLALNLRARREAERQLEQSRQKYDTVFDLVPIGVVLSDPVTGELHEVNERFREIFGYDEVELLGRRSLELGMWEDPSRRSELVRRAREEGGFQGEEAWFRRRSGERGRMMLSCRRLVLAGEDRLLWAVEDVTERRRREEALVRSEERYRALFEDSVDPIVLTTPDGDILDANAAFTEQFGFPRSEFESMNVADCYVDEGARERFLGALEGSGAVRDFELRLETRSGEIRVVRISSRVHRSPDGGVAYLQKVLHDVTELKRMEERLRHRALHDPLTDLANRDLLRERIEAALDRSRRSGEPLAVAVLDLNRFKRVNDSLGHAAGDRVLAEVAGRLRETLRAQDTVARIGGDEFALLLEELDGELAVRSSLERVQASLRRPYEVAGESVRIDQSLGAVLYRPGGDLEVGEPEDLVRYADIAMYRGREVGTGTDEVHFYRPEIATERTTVVRREQQLRAAIQAGDFGVYHQPVVELASGRIVGLEALARWRHPDLGLLGPDAFLPLAEDTGLIVPLGHVLFDRACRSLAAWSEARSPDEGELWLCFNVSVRQLAEDAIAERFADTAREHGIAPDRITLEITETALMRSRARADALADEGFRLGIDDFGTGYASLAYLKLLDVDVLKIDRTFVDGLGREPADTAIVETVLTLGQSLGLEILAEGVETDDQLRRLQGLGCRLGQGYHLGRPLPGDDVPELLAGMRPSTA